MCSILGARGRLVGRLILGATLVVGGAVAWQLTSALQDRADDLTRHVRVDIWSAQHAEWTAKGVGVNVVLYCSGKLLVQG